MEDPKRPGYTETGYKLPSLDAEFTNRRLHEAVGGAAGGAVFGGLQLAASSAGVGHHMRGPQTAEQPEAASQAPEPPVTQPRKPSDDLPPTDLMVEESEQDRMQREGTLPPPTTEQRNRPEVEVVPAPNTAEQPVAHSVAIQPFAIPTNKGRAKMAEKILTSQGVDAEAAALMGARLHAQLDDDLDVEEFRAQVLSGFEAGGGVLPGSIPNAYVEDAATYEAQGYSAEESAAHARNAQAANAAAREVAQQQNRDLVTAARREAEAVDSAETEATLTYEERAAPNSAATVAGAGGAADTIDRAIDHLTGDAGTVRRERETTSRTGTGGASSAAEEIAAAAGVPLMQEADVSSLEEMQSGNEHDVYLLPAEGGLRHVLKVTLANLGLRRGPRVLNMTTADYLRRWKLSNTVFSNVAKLVGVMQTPEGVRLVMKQPFVPAADKNQPHPQGREVNRWLEAAGFEYQSGAWVRAEDGVVLNDEHEGNFIKTKDGIRPIDIVMTRLPDAKGPVIPWEQTLQRLRAAGLETTPQSETSAAFNMDEKEGSGGPGASSLKEWGETKFGQRLKADDRLRESWRRHIGGQYRVESEAEWQQRANDFIEQNGIEGAFALMVDSDSGLSPSDRVALGLQLTLTIDGQIRAAEGASDTARVELLDDLMYETGEYLEQYLTKLGQGVRAAGMWTRMSAEGVLRTFERKVNDSRQADATLKLGGDPQKIADDVNTAAKEEREDVAAEALGETTADQLAELQRQVAELRQQLAQAEAEASAAQQEVTCGVNWWNGSACHKRCASASAN